jgi:hypothetical protein
VGRRFAALASALALGIAGLAAACGGDGGGALTREEYADRLNEICREFDEFEEEVGEPTGLADFAEKGGRLADRFEEGLSEVREFEPPEEVADTAGAFVENGERQLELVRRVLDAAEDGDEERIQELVDEGDPIDVEGDRLARELGAGVCADDCPRRLRRPLAGQSPPSASRGARTRGG